MRARSMKQFAGALCSVVGGRHGRRGSPRPVGRLEEDSRRRGGADVAVLAALHRAGNGLYRDKGLERCVDLLGQRAGPMQLLISGDVDFAITTSDVGFDAVSRGAKIRLIGGYMSSRPFIMMSKPDIKTAADLKGKAVGVSPPRDLEQPLHVTNGCGRRASSRPRSTRSFNSDTVRATRLSPTARRYGAMLSPPVSFKAEKDGFDTILDIGEYLRGVPFLSIFARSDWLETHGEEARAFLATQSDAIDSVLRSVASPAGQRYPGLRIKMERPLIERDLRLLSQGPEAVQPQA